MGNNKKYLLSKLAEIKRACIIATSTGDINLNVVVVEIEHLAYACIDVLSKEP